MENVIQFAASASASAPGATACANCRSSTPCLVRTLPAERRDEIARYVSAVAPIPRGEHLFRQGQSMNAFYMMRAGAVKSYIDSEDGCEQVAAFHFPGDILGFDALAERRHMSSAMALETVAFCTVPFDRVLDLTTAVPGLWSALMRGAANHIVDAGQHAMLLGQRSAPARLAAFLLSLSHRFAARGCSAIEFNLPMSRQDIANYLAVAVETISRLFSDLQRRGALDVDRRFVKILQMQVLETLANEGQTNRATHA